MQQSVTMNADTKKPRKGVAINFFDGVKRHQWLIVEYDDGTASIHGDWDEAIAAGEFDFEAESEKLKQELDSMVEEWKPTLDQLDREIAEIAEIADALNSELTEI